MVKVTGICGSPKKFGNTEKLLDSFLRGAESAGGETEKIRLRNIQYRSCQGCNACHKTGVCVIKDELTPVLDRVLAEADILAIASPIYSMTITSEMKGFIDRTQYLWARKFVTKDLTYSSEHLERHRGFFISTAGQDLETVFDAAFPVLTAFFNDAGFEYSKNITAGGMDRYKGIEGHPSALNDAYEAGAEAVKELKAP